jgi:hypothetical protein
VSIFAKHFFMGASGLDWAQKDKLTASDAEDGDQFGYSVSINGNYAIVGAIADDDAGTSSGSAYIFIRSGSSWSQQAKLTASDAVAGDAFGWSVDISGDYAIVGASTAGDGAGTSFVGSAYIFVRSGTSWSQQAELIASDAKAGDRFGWSVSIDGDYAIVGTLNADAAYVFVRSGTSWSEQQILTATGVYSGDRFGYSVGISGDYAIVGAEESSIVAFEAGSAYIFVRSGTSWSQQAELIASDAAGNDSFGHSVSMDGDYVVVGTSGAEAAYVFVRSGTSWSEQSILTAIDGSANDDFGESVSISGDYVVVGASSDLHSGLSGAGSAYVFAREGSGWSQTAKIISDDAASSDRFGSSVAIDSNYVIVGAPFDDDAEDLSGSAYIFMGA